VNKGKVRVGGALRGGGKEGLHAIQKKGGAEAKKAMGVGNSKGKSAGHEDADVLQVGDTWAVVSELQTVYVSLRPGLDNGGEDGVADHREKESRRRLGGDEEDDSSEGGWDESNGG
ncbi:unnamed protein product, partial [Discosporangium mesarthrocarpum]